MTDLRQAAQQALKAWDTRAGIDTASKAFEALRAALAREQAEPAQEPIGYLWPTGMHPKFRFTQQKRDGVDGTPLYAAPFKLVPLTDGELMNAYIDFDRTSNRAWSRAEYLLHLCCAIQRALEEKNRGR